VAAAAAAKECAARLAEGVVAPSGAPTKSAASEIHPSELPALRRRLKRAGQAHMLAAQTGHFKTGFKRREIVLIWRPPGPDTPSFLASQQRGES
jgi:hypothetical protein